MPSGVSWPVYLRFCTAAMLSMLAGAQLVHHIYKPLDDLEEYIQKEQSILKEYQQVHSSSKKSP